MAQQEETTTGMQNNFSMNEIRNLIREEISRAWLQQETSLLNRKEAASMLGVKENTLATWAMKGTGPASTKIGRRVMYSSAILEKYIQENTMPR